jgi:uncharacterized membrane protein (DUF485 family)
MSNSNSRFGLFLFALYLLLYAGFVLLAAFAPQAMEATPFASVNLAIWYGFGLIISAIVLAFIYGWVCRPGDPESGDATDGTRSVP